MLQSFGNQTPSDNVNHPSHYQGSVECIDAIKASMSEEEFIAFCKGNAMKYMWRAGKKGDALEDFKKAQFYIDRVVKEVGKE